MGLLWAHDLYSGTNWSVKVCFMVQVCLVIREQRRRVRNVQLGLTFNCVDIIVLEYLSVYVATGETQ